MNTSLYLPNTTKNRYADIHAQTHMSIDTSIRKSSMELKHTRNQFKKRINPLKTVSLHIDNSNISACPDDLRLTSKILPKPKVKKLPDNKEVEDTRLQKISSILTMQTPTYDKKNALSQSVDVTSMKEYLALQRNRFIDLFTFGDKGQPLKVPSSRVKNNAQLNQIYAKLRDPSLNKDFLEKSLIIRDPEAAIYQKKRLIE